MCETINSDLYEKFSSSIKKICQALPAQYSVEILELEDMFVQKMLVVKDAYRIGLEDGIKLKEFQELRRNK